MNHPELTREVTGHHDGHGLTEMLLIRTDGPGPGGASHYYVVTTAGNTVADIQYQYGPRNVEGSTAGILDSVLLAIVKDRMESFQAGPFACSDNEDVLIAVTQGLAVLKRRADERAARGVLGHNKT